MKGQAHRLDANKQWNEVVTYKMIDTDVSFEKLII
jgi:hypothetical protein